MAKAKSKYLIQRQMDGSWKDEVSLDLSSTIDAIRHIKKAELVGTFSIIAVKKTVTATVETKKVVRLEGAATDGIEAQL